MALSISTPTAVVNTTLNQQTYSLAAFTPTANSLLVVGVAITGTFIDPPTVTGGGLTWTSQFISISYGSGGANSAWLFTAPVGASPSSTTFTVDLGAGNSGTGASIVP